LHDVRRLISIGLKFDDIDDYQEIEGNNDQVSQEDDESQEEECEDEDEDE
jgi:hypothetical protein